MFRGINALVFRSLWLNLNYFARKSHVRSDGYVGLTEALQ